MTARKLSLALAAAALMAGTAFAQGALVEVKDSVQVVPFNATADEVDDWDVYDASGTEIGDVEDVVGTDANTPTALVVDFKSKSAYGDRDVVIPLDQFSLQGNRLILNADAATVGQMPTWDD
ncbi:MAG TPA: PRC-barrel domain-containing protein [Mycoplana sp.]|nr:PRC-barrel domain-containing protein [Mycoplana sp.]